MSGIDCSSRLVSELAAYESFVVVAVPVITWLTALPIVCAPPFDLGGGGTHKPSAHLRAPIAAPSRAKAMPDMMPRMRPIGASATFTLDGMSLAEEPRIGAMFVLFIFRHSLMPLLM